jgi:hypothetical protein
MDNTPGPETTAIKIVAVDTLPEYLVVAFSDGCEFVYPAEVLRVIVPEEMKLVERIRDLFSLVGHARQSWYHSYGISAYAGTIRRRSALSCENVQVQVPHPDLPAAPKGRLA